MASVRIAADGTMGPRVRFWVREYEVKTADDILASIERFCLLISGTGH
jgi:hypothetical protein